MLTLSSSGRGIRPLYSVCAGRISTGGSSQRHLNTDASISLQSFASLKYKSLDWKALISQASCGTKAKTGLFEELAPHTEVIFWGKQKGRRWGRKGFMANKWIKQKQKDPRAPQRETTGSLRAKIRAIFQLNFPGCYFSIMWRGLSFVASSCIDAL